jgi:hypothetical protein
MDDASAAEEDVSGAENVSVASSSLSCVCDLSAGQIMTAHCLSYSDTFAVSIMRNLWHLLLL